MTGTLALWVAGLLMVLLAASFVRIALGPTQTDHIIGLQLVGSGLTAMALLLAIGLGLPRLLDLALVFAVLAPIASVIFSALPAKREDGASG